MSHFNEGEKAKEERRKYQKTAQVLTLFIVSYIAQWVTWIVYCIWSFVTLPPIIMVSLQFTVFISENLGQAVRSVRSWYGLLYLIGTFC